jgi:hypothetical protein
LWNGERASAEAYNVGCIMRVKANQTSSRVISRREVDILDEDV